jgi:hypothetical protein
VLAVKPMARIPKKPTRKLRPQQIVEEVGRLCDYYGLPRNNSGAAHALWSGISDGLVKIKPKLNSRRGAPGIWRGEVGFDLVRDVEYLSRAIEIDGHPKPKVAQVIRVLKELKPDKWGKHLDLYKRFYEAKRFWTDTRRLALVARLPWDWD